VIPIGSGIKIPAYYVDHSVGLDLYHQLEQMASVPIVTIPANKGMHVTACVSVRVSLLPAENVKPLPWELTLLVMIVILGVSAIFSGTFCFLRRRKRSQIYTYLSNNLVVMHIYMWKKGRSLLGVVERHRAPGQQVEDLPMGKALLTVARLCEFPTRTVDSLLDEEERIEMETVLSDEKQLEALINTTSLRNKNSNQNSKSFFRRKKLRKETSIASVAIKIDVPVNSMCVVCLEAFKIGDRVRELPCHHEYHCICIGKIESKPSSLCIH
jgi:hypothetical protein